MTLFNRVVYSFPFIRTGDAIIVTCLMTARTFCFNFLPLFSLVNRIIFFREKDPAKNVKLPRNLIYQPGLAFISIPCALSGGIFPLKTILNGDKLKQ